VTEKGFLMDVILLAVQAAVELFSIWKPPFLEQKTELASVDFADSLYTAPNVKLGPDLILHLLVQAIIKMKSVCLRRRIRRRKASVLTRTALG